MKALKPILNTLVVTGSLLLAAGFVAYRAGVFDSSSERKNQDESAIGTLVLCFDMTTL